MKRKTAMLMGAAAALTAGPALAQLASAPAEPAVPDASSYADLLQPIPNAVERLRISDMQEQQAAPAQVIEARYQAHHHHHHHHHNRAWYSSHGYVYWNGAWIIRPAWWANRRHHHHHHHNSYPNGGPRPY